MVLSAWSTAFAVRLFIVSNAVNLLHTQETVRIHNFCVMLRVRLALIGPKTSIIDTAKGGALDFPSAG